MSDILAFIGARLGDEEADARAVIAAFGSRRHPSQGAWAASVDEAGPGVELLDWSPSDEPPEAEVNVMGGKWGQIGHWDEEMVGYDGEDLDGYEDLVKHIARQDPRATLARVAALRALVTWATEPYAMAGGPAARGATDAARREVLRHVTNIWPDHPDFDESWRP